MSHKRRFTRRAQASAAAVAALSAAAAFNAAPAFASTGASIIGSGSSLQNTVQQNLLGGYNALHSGSGGVNITAGKVTYNATSSGDGLAEFGDATATINGVTFNAGTLNPGASNANGNGTALDAYIGTDDPATTSQISSANSASGVSQIGLPVTQAPVAMIFSIPSAITLSSTAKLDVTNQLLYQVWTHTVPANAGYSANTWGAILTLAGLTYTSGTPSGQQFTGTATSSSVSLEARSDGSGTTFTFRGYLNEVDTSLHSGTPSVYQLSNVTDSATVNSSTGWPTLSGLTINEAVGGTANKGSGAEATNTASVTTGGVGYVNLANAVASSPGFRSTPVNSSLGGTSHQLIYAQVQDNGTAVSGAKFAEPSANASSPTTAAANVYTGGSAGTTPAVGNWTVPSADTGSWAASNGEVAPADDPNAYTHGGSSTVYYPIVAATWDEVWSSYTTSGTKLNTLLTNESQVPQQVSNTVTDFFKNYVYQSSGQTKVASDGYAKLPVDITSVGSTFAGKLSAIQ